MFIRVAAFIRVNSKSTNKALVYYYHGTKPYRILVVENRILVVISGLSLCKDVCDGRGRCLVKHL